MKKGGVILLAVWFCFLISASTAGSTILDQNCECEIQDSVKTEWLKYAEIFSAKRRGDQEINDTVEYFKKNCVPGCRIEDGSTCIRKEVSTSLKKISFALVPVDEVIGNGGFSKEIYVNVDEENRVIYVKINSSATSQEKAIQLIFCVFLLKNNEDNVLWDPNADEKEVINRDKKLQIFLRKLRGQF